MGPCVRRDDAWRLRCPIPQLEPLNLTRRRLRQTIHHVDPARIFPRADLLLDVLLQRFIQTVGVAIRAQHHEGLRFQQPFGIGVKSAGGFRAEYDPFAAQIIYVDTRGPADSDLTRLPFQRIDSFR